MHIAGMKWNHNFHEVLAQRTYCINGKINDAAITSTGTILATDDQLLSSIQINQCENLSYPFGQLVG